VRSDASLPVTHAVRVWVNGWPAGTPCTRSNRHRRVCPPVFFELGADGVLPPTSPAKSRKQRRLRLQKAGTDHTQETVPTASSSAVGSSPAFDLATRHATRLASPLRCPIDAHTRYTRVGQRRLAGLPWWGVTLVAMAIVVRDLFSKVSASTSRMPKLSSLSNVEAIKAEILFNVRRCRLFVLTFGSLAFRSLSRIQRPQDKK